MSNTGTYIVRVGDTFYIGSSSNFRKRKYDHLGSLKSGIHPNPKLQRAYATLKTAAFVPHRFIPRLDDESDADFRKRLRDAEQALLDAFVGHEHLANLSPSAFGPDNGEILRKKWETREFRELMSKIQRVKGSPSEHTRRLMAEAKKGANNPKARTLEVICPDGSSKFFDTVTDAASFFGVKQQVMDLWVRGVVAWPGTGRRKPRAANQWIAAYTLKV